MDTAPSSSRAVTSYLVAEVRRLTEQPLPDEVMEVARHCVLDWFGVLGEARAARLRETLMDTNGWNRCVCSWTYQAGNDKGELEC